MRADRLVATVLLLQQRGRVTAAELAEELEISVATARRDLEALSSAGVPVYPQPGRGGGWSLVGGARTDLSGLTAGEAQALFLLVGPAAAVSDEAKGALRKLVRALPATFREDALAAATATTIDPAGWGSPARPRPALVDELQPAVVRRLRVRLTYAGRAGGSERVVDPWGLVDKDGVWYLVAGTDRGRRTFRLDRVDVRRGHDRDVRRGPTASTSTRSGTRWSRRWRAGAPGCGPRCSSPSAGCRSCATTSAGTASTTGTPRTGARGSGSAARSRSTWPGRWPAGARWSRWSTLPRSPRSWRGSAPSWSRRTADGQPASCAASAWASASVKSPETWSWPVVMMPLTVGAASTLPSRTRASWVGVPTSCPVASASASRASASR